MASLDHKRGNLQFALYAYHLATGNTLFCRSIKVSTIKKYLHNIAAFFRKFGPRERDFRMTEGTTTFIPELSKLFTELQRWESVPDRREPFTLDMLHALYSLVSTTQVPPDSDLAGLQDWFTIGLFAGLRKSEWAQNAGTATVGSQQRNIFGDTQAFCVNDFRFELSTGRRLTGYDVLSMPAATVTKLRITFRTQKNGENGEEKLFARNEKPQGCCCVRAAIRVLERFQRLRGNSDFTTPLAIYRTTDGQCRLITSDLVEREMRKLAAKIYHLDPIKDREALQRWSCHSLRVGACVILHGKGFTETQIKFLLRWRSNAFMMYLRNLTVLSRAQNAAFESVAAMPDFY
jgi:hypothetical protein